MDSKGKKNVINVINDKRVEGGREEGTENGWQRKEEKKGIFRKSEAETWG